MTGRLCRIKAFCIIIVIVCAVAYPLINSWKYSRDEYIKPVGQIWESIGSLPVSMHGSIGFYSVRNIESYYVALTPHGKIYAIINNPYSSYPNIAFFSEVGSGIHLEIQNNNDECIINIGATRISHFTESGLSVAGSLKKTGSGFEVAKNRACGHSLYKPSSREAEPVRLYIFDERSELLIDEISIPYTVIDNGWTAFELMFP